jgi:hypothetical protein
MHHGSLVHLSAIIDTALVELFQTGGGAGHLQWQGICCAAMEAAWLIPLPLRRRQEGTATDDNFG